MLTQVESKKLKEDLTLLMRLASVPVKLRRGIFELFVRELSDFSISDDVQRAFIQRGAKKRQNLNNLTISDFRDAAMFEKAELVRHGVIRLPAPSSDWSKGSYRE